MGRLGMIKLNKACMIIVISVIFVSGGLLTGCSNKTNNNKQDSYNSTLKKSFNKFKSAKTDNKKLSYLKKLKSESENYSKDSKSSDKYSTYVKKEKSYFINKDKKVLKDNTLSEEQIENTSKEKLNTKSKLIKKYMSNVKKENEIVYSKNEMNKLLSFANSLNDKYTNQISSLSSESSSENVESSSLTSDTTDVSSSNTETVTTGNFLEYLDKYFKTVVGWDDIVYMQVSNTEQADGTFRVGFYPENGFLGDDRSGHVHIDKDGLVTVERVYGATIPPVTKITLDN